VNVETEGDSLAEGCHWLTSHVDVTRLTGLNVALLMVDSSLYYTITDGLAKKNVSDQMIHRALISRHCCFKGFMNTATL